MSALRKISKRVGLLAASFGLALIVAELAVRVFAPQPPSWLAIFERHPSLPFYRNQPGLDASAATGETRFRVLTDERGFRVGAGSREGPARKTVLWLGDSFTFGQGLDYEQTFVGLIKAASEDGVRHVNSGVNGYGPAQYRQTLEDALRSGLDPQAAVVVVYTGNDFQDCVWDKDVPVEHGLLGGRSGLKMWIKTRSHLYRLVAAAYHRMAVDAPDPYAEVTAELADPEAWEGAFLPRCEARLTEELQAIAELGRREGVAVRFVVLPTEEAVSCSRDGGATERWEPRTPTYRVLNALEGNDVLDLLDALAEYPTSELYFRFDGHFNPRGSEVVAGAIAKVWPDLLTPE